jgi:hypothetical protein
VSSNVGSAFVAEAARYPSLALAEEAFCDAASLVVALSLVGVMLTSLGLRILGQEYSTTAESFCASCSYQPSPSGHQDRTGSAFVATIA